MVNCNPETVSTDYDTSDRLFFEPVTLEDVLEIVALEQPKRYSVSLNGTPLDTDAVSGWWVDRSLERIPFDPTLLKAGRNELEISCDYDANHPGFEIIYLLGSFGASVAGSM